MGFEVKARRGKIKVIVIKSPPSPNLTKAPKKSWRSSVTLAFACFFLVVLLYSLLVYVVPTLSGQDIAESFDAFSYAEWLQEDPEFIKERQPFLTAYPASLAATLLPIYAAILHFSLLAVPLVILCKHLKRHEMFIFFAALSIPESAIFLGAVSKEGLSIVAVIAALAGQKLFFEKKIAQSILLTACAIGIAAFSRPGFGYLFLVAVLGGYYPSLTKRNKAVIRWLVMFSVVMLIWIILYGPLKEQASEAYTNGKEFIEWFEVNLSNDDSAFKSSVRGIFALVFLYDQPSLIFLSIAVISGFMKAVVYFLAIPAIAFPSFTKMPSLTWALTWQFAVSTSSIVLVYNTWTIFKMRRQLTVENRCRLWFGYIFFFLLAISTFIFHVRYRAPAVVAILIACWMARGKGASSVVSMTIPALCGACYAILSTA